MPGAHTGTHQPRGMVTAQCDAGSRMHDVNAPNIVAAQAHPARIRQPQKSKLSLWSALPKPVFSIRSRKCVGALLHVSSPSRMVPQLTSMSFMRLKTSAELVAS